MDVSEPKWIDNKKNCKFLRRSKRIFKKEKKVVNKNKALENPCNQQELVELYNDLFNVIFLYCNEFMQRNHYFIYEICKQTS